MVAWRPTSGLADVPTAAVRPPSLWRGAPRAWSNQPNANPVNGTVGPNAATPNDDVLAAELKYAQAWSGWPSSWKTPYLEDASLFADAGGQHQGGQWTGFGYGRQSPSGYLSRVSTVMSAVDLNTRQLASFPIYAVHGVDPERLPSWSENPEPELYAGWDEFMKAAANMLQLRGEVFLYATGRFFNGYPSRFVALDPLTVRVYHDDGELRYWHGGDDGDELDPADVCHIKYQAAPRRLRGISPLEWLGRSLVSADALERYATDIALHGVWSVLKNPANLSSTQREDAKRNWQAARLNDPGAPAVLSGQWEFDTLSLSPRDMALLDLRTYDEQRIAAAFGVPPFLIGLEQPGGMTYANATSLYDHHWRATLRPMAQTFSNAMSRWLLPQGHRIEFNRDEYVRPALAERAQAYAVLHAIEEADGSRAMTVQEIRDAERFATTRIHDDERTALTFS